MKVEQTDASTLLEAGGKKINFNEKISKELETVVVTKGIGADGIPPNSAQENCKNCLQID